MPRPGAAQEQAVRAYCQAQGENTEQDGRVGHAVLEPRRSMRCAPYLRTHALCAKTAGAWTRIMRRGGVSGEGRDEADNWKLAVLIAGTAFASYDGQQTAVPEWPLVCRALPHKNGASVRVSPTNSLDLGFSAKYLDGNGPARQLRFSCNGSAQKAGEVLCYPSTNTAPRSPGISRPCGRERRRQIATLSAKQKSGHHRL